MPNIGLQINYRPLRIGYCLQDNDFEGLRQVSVLNTYISGGIYNPIIVILESDTERQIIDKVLVSRPDILYAPNKKLRTKLKVFDRDYLPVPFEFHGELVCEHEGVSNFQILDIELIIRDIWESYMKMSRKKHSNCILPTWDKTDGLDLLFSLMFGSFTLKDKFPINYEKSFLRGLKARQLRIEKDSNIQSDFFNSVTPLLFTAEGLTPHYTTPYRDRGFVIGRSDNFNDLVSYWNFRTMNPGAFFLPIESHDRFVASIEIIKDKLSTIAKTGKHPGHSDFLLHYSKDNEKAAKRIQDQYFSDPKVFRTEYRQNPYSAKRGLFYFEEQPTQGNVDRDDQGHFSVSFQLPNFKYRDKDKFFPKRFFMVSFSFLTEFEYPQHTFQMPDFCDMNEWYARKIHFQYDRLRVEPKGFGIIVDDMTHFLSLRPVFLPDLLTKLFERATVKGAPSKSGKIARQIIEQMRDIEGCRVFKITGVRNLLRSIGPLNEKTRKQCRDKIEDRDNGSFPQFESLYIESREEPKLTPEMAFDFLVKKKVFMPGVLIKCSKCDLESWVTINNFSDPIDCPLCSNKFSPLIKDPGGITWQFRRSGLFGEGNNQEGAIPVLLTLLQLARTSHDARLFTGYDLEYDGKKCELDLVVLDVRQHYYNEKPEIIIGECKDVGRRMKEQKESIPPYRKLRYQITDENIENMVNIKKLLDKSGFHAYLLFSTTASHFSDDEIKRFKKLETQYIQPILFTANELEPYHPYDKYDRQRLPHSYAVAYDHLAQNSKFIYLGNQKIEDLLKHD